MILLVNHQIFKIISLIQQNEENIVLVDQVLLLFHLEINIILLFGNKNSIIIKLNIIIMILLIIFKSEEILG